MADERVDRLLADPEDVSALSLERAEADVTCQRCGRRAEQTWTLTLTDEGDAQLRAFDVCSRCAALFTRSLTLTYHQSGGM